VSTALDEAVVRDRLIDAVHRAVTDLPQDVEAALERARAAEPCGRAAAELTSILANVNVARTRRVPMCQDTGTLTFFVDAGTKSPFLARLPRMIADAAAAAALRIPLRANTVHPITGRNPGDNSGVGMPIVHWRLLEGACVRIAVLPKGAGGENMSRLLMLAPAEGVAGVKKAVVDHVIACGGMPCPPTVLGIGIGGGAETAMLLGKRALLRRLGDRHDDATVAVLEHELLDLVNATGVGPMGLGGATTCLAVHVGIAHRHPASLPVGIVVQCWADRRAWVELRADGSVEVC